MKKTANQIQNIRELVGATIMPLYGDLSYTFADKFDLPLKIERRRRRQQSMFGWKKPESVAEFQARVIKDAEVIKHQMISHARKVLHSVSNDDKVSIHLDIMQKFKTKQITHPLKPSNPYIYYDN